MKEKAECANLVRNNIAALIPEYLPQGGNATRIVMVEGEEKLDKRTLRWVLKSLAKNYGVDPEALRREYGELLGRSRCVPLPFSPRIVLVPLRFRKVIAPADGATGYVSCLQVEEIESSKDSKGKSFVRLKNGITLTCLHPYRTALRRLRQGELVMRQYLHRLWEDFPPLISGPEFELAREGSPAETEDVKFLIRLLLSFYGRINRLPWQKNKH